MREPTNEELRLISEWDAKDLHGLMEFIKPLWNYSDCGYWTRDGEEYRISTAGWSDNEEIIANMQANHVWWMFYWYQSQRGGHYIFRGREKVKP